MKVAVDARFVIPENMEGFGNFTYETFKILVQQYPQHQFYFIFDRQTTELFPNQANVHQIILSPAARHPILWKWWYNVKIPLFLKKIKAEVFVDMNGFCSLNTSVPQVLVLHDLGFIHYPEFYKSSHVRFYKRNTPTYIKKAACLATVSKFSADDIVKQYNVNREKVHIVYNGIKSSFQPISQKTKTETKEVFTQGKEYFLYSGAIHPRKNLINLLKAFSIFKKRMKSNMKLVLAGRLAWKNDEFLQLIKTYKYKEDVIITGYVSDEVLINLMGSCYAFVYPSLFEGFGIPVIEAMQMKVPVLTSEKSSMQEITDGSAIYFNPEDFNDIADKMMMIYKDEAQRKTLIENGSVIATNYSWKRTANLLWDCILEAVNKNSR